MINEVIELPTSDKAQKKEKMNTIRDLIGIPTADYWFEKSEGHSIIQFCFPNFDVSSTYTRRNHGKEETIWWGIWEDAFGNEPCWDISQVTHNQPNLINLDVILKCAERSIEAKKAVTASSSIVAIMSDLKNRGYNPVYRVNTQEIIILD
jgi:hypothetical protein